MEKYECAIIINPYMDENKQVTLVNKIKNDILMSGHLFEFNKLGKKKLAYEIKGMLYAFYYQFSFIGDKMLVEELDRFFRTDDNILKFIIMKAE